MWTDEGEGKVLYVQTHGVSDPGRCATPFFLAAKTADAELMRTLAALGADPLLPNADNSTPLMAADCSANCTIFCHSVMLSTLSTLTDFPE